MSGHDQTPESTAIVLSVQHVAPQAALVAFRDSFRQGASRTTMLASLAACARQLSGGAVEDPLSFPWQLLRYEHVRALAARMAELGLSPATQQLRISAVRRIVEECWKVNLVERDTVDRIRSVKAQKRDKNAPLAGRVLDPAEQTALHSTAKAGAGDAGPRDTALVTLSLSGGLRREETSGLPLWNGQLGLRADQAKLVVMGKGGKIREVPLGTQAMKRLEPWLAIRGTKPGSFLWCLHAQSYHALRTVIADRALSPSGIYSTLADIGYRARVKDFSPHDCRRTFITELLDRGVDVITVARMAGHDDVKTTMRYDRRGERAMRAAAEALEQEKP